MVRMARIMLGYWGVYKVVRVVCCSEGVEDYILGLVSRPGIYDFTQFRSEARGGPFVTSPAWCHRGATCLLGPEQGQRRVDKLYQRTRSI